MSELRAKVMAAFEKIGHVNGTKPPESQDRLDAAAYEYMIASAGASYFDKRKKNALTELIGVLGKAQIDKLQKVVTRVSENGIKEDADLASGENVKLMAEVKTGASYIDTDKLRVELKKKMKSADVDKLFAECTERRQPSIGYRVLEVE